MHTSLVTRDGPLCERCSDPYLQAFFDTVPPPESGARKEFSLSIDGAALSSTCPFCSLIRCLTMDSNYFHVSRGDTSPMEFVSMSTMDNPSGRISLWGHWGMAAEADRSRPLLDWPKDPSRVDFGPLKQKLAQCKTEHGHTCEAKNRLPVEGLQVYNCLTRRLEKATTDTKYVALSYVWGSDRGNSSQKPPEKCRTIRDAMKVTLRLGYKYIWVDQLCINQDGTHRLQQIQRMNRIYQNADLTVVAAAGDNSDFGIPGVQDRSRLARSCFKIGDLQFAETVPAPWTLLFSTTYRSRAWIFQEEKLSHRLLVFTERAAWFSCYLTTAEEGFETQSRENEKISLPGTDSALAKKTPRPPCGLGVPLRFDLLIREYSDKLLTYPSDAVNAFSGILAALEEAKLIVSHVWGTPIMPPIALINSQNEWDPGSGVVDLERNSVDGFIVGLMWECFDLDVFKPRHGIPSWSWVGWQGLVRFPELHQEENVNLGIEAFIERTDGQVLAWSEFEGMSYLKSQTHLISRFIRLKAWTVDVKLEFHSRPVSGCFVDSGDEVWIYAVVQMLNGDELLSSAIILCEPRMTSRKKQLGILKPRECTGVCLFPINDTSKSVRYVMVLHEVDGHFQRIGHFKLGAWGLLRQTTLSGEATYCKWENNGWTSRALGLNARMEEIRIG